MNADLTSIKKIVCKTLIDHNENVSQCFRDYSAACGKGHYLKKFLHIINLNLKYRVLKKDIDVNLNHLTMPESHITRLPSPAELTRQLACYDVISFDIFDTLIFRAVNAPRDVFRLLESELNIMGFAQKRESAEKRVRENKAEATIEAIYQIMSEELNINSEKAILLEIETEKKVCFANPYMKEVFDSLQEQGKLIVLLSDMYLPNKILAEILTKCGFHVNPENIFISCDYGTGKSSGGLQKIVSKKYGLSNSYIHVGDNINSDIAGSKTAGWDTFYYPNVHRIGNPYRRNEMRTLASPFYKGIINTKLHSGAFKEDRYYEYGYCYGGILGVGFCQYLIKLAKEEDIEQYLFLARDGFVIQKIFEMCDGKTDHVYLPFSRFAAYQLTIERTWLEMLEHLLLPKINTSFKKNTRDILKVCDLKFIEKYSDRYNLNLNKTFDLSAYDIIVKIFRENLHEIKNNYNETVNAAKKYFNGKIKNNAKICVVDVGWKGTSVNCLKYFLEQKCGMNVQVIGALMGMNCDESAEISLANGTVFSYMFSPHHNQKTYLKHCGKYEEINYRNMLMEILFTENKPSFSKYRFDENGNVVLEYCPEENNQKILSSLQKGILDFSEDYIKYWLCFGNVLEICGQEAYIPLDSMAKAKKECMKLLGDYEIYGDPGLFDEHSKRTYKDAAKF